MIEGLQVGEGESVCHCIEERLGKGVAVINAGMGGYSPILQFLRLQELLDRVHPQIVLTAIFPNDLEEEYFYRRLARFDSNHTPAAVAAPDHGRLDGAVEGFLSSHSALWRALRVWMRPSERIGHLNQASDRDAPNVIYPFRNKWTKVERHAWNGLSDSLEQIRDACDSRGIRLLVILIPAGHQLGPDVWKDGKQLMGYAVDEWEESIAFQAEAADRAHHLGLEVIDLLPAFRDTSHPSDLYYPYDGHWTPLGHQTAADCILSSLLKDLEQTGA
jgi:hypothetical protein